ncbi:MAG: NAD(P)-binding protein [Planctomycetota bacterium]
MRAELLIVGGGILGLAAAWRCARRGRERALGDDPARALRALGQNSLRRPLNRRRPAGNKTAGQRWRALPTITGNFRTV